MNKDSALTVAIIGFLSTIGATIITAIVSYIVNRFNFNKPKKQNSLQEQYANVLAPIHRTLFYTGKIKKVSVEEKLKEIEKILYENYPIAPYSIVESFCLTLCNNDISSFEKLMDACYKNAAYKLGYTQVKTKFNRTSLNILATKDYSRKDRTSVYVAIIGAIATIIASIITLFSGN